MTVVEHLNCSIPVNIIDKSLRGTSLKHTAYSVVDFLQRKEYNSKDIFVITAPDNLRSPIINAKAMSHSHAMLYTPTVVLRDIGNNNKITQESINEIKSKGGLLAVEHYKQFYDFYKMYYTAYSVKQIVAERFMLLNIIKQLPNKVILMQCSTNLVYDWTHRDVTNDDMTTIYKSNQLLCSTTTFTNTGVNICDVNTNILGKILYDRISANLSS